MGRRNMVSRKMDSLAPKLPEGGLIQHPLEFTFI